MARFLRMVDLLVVPAGHFEVFDPIHLIDLYETIRRKLGEHSEDVRRGHGVSREHLHLEPLGVEGMAAGVVTEIPGAEEQ